MWFIIAAGVVLASILPQSRNQIKEVPWMPLTVAVGLGLISESLNGLSDSLNNSLKSIDAERLAAFEERYDIELL